MKTLIGVALFAVTAAGAGSVFAQTYPDRPVTLHVGFAPGGPADTLARLIGQQLSETLGQPVVVENAPGAGGSIAAREVAAADPSGYDLLFVTSGHAGNFTYYPNLEFAPEDLTAVAGVAQTPIVLTVAPGSEFSSLEDLIAAAEAAPGDLVYAAGGGGATLTALAAESFLREAGIEALAVSYPGSGPQNVDLMGGMLDFAFDTVSGSAPLIQGGEIKALAVTSAEPTQVLPDVPTVAASGLDEFEPVLGWFGILAPAGTDPVVVASLNDAVEKALTNEQVAEQLANQGLDPMVIEPDAFQAFIDDETVRWGGLISELGLSAE